MGVFTDDVSAINFVIVLLRTIFNGSLYNSSFPTWVMTFLMSTTRSPQLLLDQARWSDTLFVSDLYRHLFQCQWLVSILCMCWILVLGPM